MYHLRDHRKLGRTRGHRMALLRNLVVALVQHERIETTLAKAKELRRVADRMVTLGKRGTLVSRRLALRFIHDRQALSKLFKELAPRFANRNGGYTRIYKIGARLGDGSPMALIEYLPSPQAVKQKGLKKKKSAEDKS